MCRDFKTSEVGTCQGVGFGTARGGESPTCILHRERMTVLMRVSGRFVRFWRRPRVRRIRVIERPCSRELGSTARMLRRLDRFNHASLGHAPIPFICYSIRLGAVYCILSPMYLAFAKHQRIALQPFVYRAPGDATILRCSFVVTQVVHLIILR
jgi:hypothetical protein